MIIGYEEVCDLLWKRAISIDPKSSNLKDGYMMKANYISSCIKNGM